MNNSKANKENKPLTIPSTPNLKRLGYGTGVGVFHIDRSPIDGHKSSPWALKKIMRGKSALNNQVTERLRNEADILKKLNHPNIIGFRAFVNTSDGRGCLAMEECHTSLGNLLEEREHFLSSDLVQKVAREIAKALDYIHNEVHLLHGDIKSHNVLVKGNFDAIKLCDFGVSLPLTPDGLLDENAAGKNANYIGTEIWKAPEVCERKVEKITITDKADIFAYGLTIWEMLSNDTPHTCIFDESTESFDEDIYDEKLNQLIGTRPAVPIRVQKNRKFKKIIDLFMACTEENYQNRYSAKEVLKFCNDNKF